MSPVARAALASWSVPFRATVGILLAAILYVRGWKHLAYLRSTLLPNWRLACFVAGLASLWLAISSPVDAFGNFLLTAHMIQHLLMMLVAPLLILLGSPQNLLLRGLPRWAAHDVLGPFLSWRFLKRFGRFVTHPAFCWFAGATALLGWHTPALYDLALISPGWHDLEHAFLFGTSLLFWWPVVQPWPSTAHWHRWTIPVYLLCGDLVTTTLAAILCFSEQLLYPAYATVPRLFGMSELADQVTAGAIMWVFGSSVLLGAAAIVTMRLLDPSMAKAKQSVAVLKRRSSIRPAFDLLRAPIAGSLLRSRYGRRALQTCLLVIAVAIIADGFFGHPMAPMNLAGVLPWTYGRAFIVVALLAAGNLFCLACPFTLPRELGRRLGFATLNWPRVLHTKWFAVGLLVLFFWAYERFDFWESPKLTAWILVGYFAGSFAVDSFFRGASFCKYVCPIGQFNFVSSLVSPLEVGIRSREVCTSCATHDCVQGNERQRGCELDLFLPRKAGNMDCTFCLDCVKACPQDNVGILTLPPGSDLVNDPIRSSLGRFSRRLDIAALALVLVFSGFVSAAAMVAPAAAWRESVIEHLPAISAGFVTGSVFLIALVLAPAVVMSAAAAGRTLAHVEKPSQELFCRFSIALLPLGLAMWGAHVFFHLSSAWSTAWPVAQRAAGDVAVGWFGTPRWMASSPLFPPDVLLAGQLLLLDAGILLSLYVGWRIARGYTNRTQNGLLLLLPWATVTAVLFAAGVWVVFQPMEMRGMVHG